MGRLTIGTPALSYAYGDNGAYRLSSLLYISNLMYSIYTARRLEPRRSLSSTRFQRKKKINTTLHPPFAGTTIYLDQVIVLK